MLRYKHPYESEMNNSRYPTMVHIRADPIPYTPYEGTAATMVDTYEGLLAMLEELKLAREIAVDLEHHDEHSYIGLVSLMQISTRDKDWIVDTLKPWRQKLQLLNEVFADPTILKVRSVVKPTVYSDHEAGLPRCTNGYDMAAEGFWSLCRWFVRHFSRISCSEVSEEWPGVSIKALRWL